MDKRDNREYDGVAYIPGGHKPPPDMGETRKINVGDFKPAPAVALEPEPEPSIKSDGPKAKERKVPTKTQAKKTNYAIILVTTVFVGVIAAVFVFAMVIDRLIDNGGGGQATGGGVGANLGQTQPTPGGGITLPETTLPVAPGSLSLTGVVQEIRSNRLDLYVFEMSEVRSFFVENTSDLRDRFGNPITFPQFAIGDVVDVGHAPHSNTIENAQISAEVRAYREITGVMVDGDTLQIGNRRYTLSATPIVRYQNDSANISELDPIDQITVSIFQDRYVALIEIHRGHGEITLPDNESIIDGTVEVGIGIMQALGEGGMTLRVPAGQSRVTIRGSNIEPLMVDVNVPRGGLTSVSFAGLEYRAGSLIVRSNTEDAIMYIGERWEPLNEEINLDFGTHTITVEAFGHETFTTEVEISAQPVEITANLTAIAATRIITINTNPPNARVYVDDDFRGTSPLNLELPHGRHSISLELMGFISVGQPIFVTAESQALYNFMLVRDPAWPIFD